MGRTPHDRAEGIGEAYIWAFTRLMRRGSTERGVEGA